MYIFRSNNPSAADQKYFSNCRRLTLPVITGNRYTVPLCGNSQGTVQTEEICKREPFHHVNTIIANTPRCVNAAAVHHLSCRVDLNTAAVIMQDYLLRRMPGTCHALGSVLAQPRPVTGAARREGEDTVGIFHRE